MPNPAMLRAPACIAALIAAAFALPASGHVIDVTFSTPSAEAPLVGERVEVEVLGALDEAGEVIGGAMTLSFDPGVLRFVSLEVNPALTDIRGPEIEVDATTGTVTGIQFAADPTVTLGTDFSFGTLLFQALGAGTSELVLEDARNPVFVWQVVPATGSDTTLTPRFSPGSVRVQRTPVEPLPAEKAAALTAVIQLLLDE